MAVDFTMEDVEMISKYSPFRFVNGDTNGGRVEVRLNYPGGFRSFEYSYERCVDEIHALRGVIAELGTLDPSDPLVRIGGCSIFGGSCAIHGEDYRPKTDNGGCEEAPGSHYHGCEYEARKVAAAWINENGLDGEAGAYFFNIVKYLARVNVKGDPVENIKKAIDYAYWFFDADADKFGYEFGDDGPMFDVDDVFNDWRIYNQIDDHIMSAHYYRALDTLAFISHKCDGEDKRGDLVSALFGIGMAYGYVPDSD